MELSTNHSSRNVKDGGTYKSVMYKSTIAVVVSLLQTLVLLDTLVPPSSHEYLVATGHD